MLTTLDIQNMYETIYPKTVNYTDHLISVIKIFTIETLINLILLELSFYTHNEISKNI